MKYFIQTFGCQMNNNDSILVAGMMNNCGYHNTGSPDDADIIIVNTCCVRESAESRALGYIGSLKHLHTKNPMLIIILMGCMMQRSGVVEQILQSYRHVGIIIGTFAASSLPRYISEYQATGAKVVDIDEDYANPQPKRRPEASFDDYTAQVNISYGCNNFCTYCIVPYVRGRERSRKPIEIIAEINSLAEKGLKEVQLLGQNVNSYGKDFSKDDIDFASLLIKINDIKGLERIRYMTSHPRDFDRRLAETIAALPKVCHHFHLPIQSGCDRILKLMNRSYDTTIYLQKLTQIRNLCPDATITTDFIVGFPGETDEDFQQTLDFMTKARFDTAYSFLYSRRSGTLAAEFPKQVADCVKKERLQRLMELQNPISLELNQSLLGKVLPVMVEGKSKNNSNMLSGRTDGNKIVIFPVQTGLKPGDTICLRITKAKTWNLEAEALNKKT